MDSSLTSMSLKASENLWRRGSGLRRKRMVQTLSINPMINYRRSKKRVKQAGDVGDNTTHWEGFGRIPPQGGLQADGEENLREDGAVDGCIPLWRTRWKRQDYRRWRLMPTSDRTQSHSSLRPGPLWTYVWKRRRGQGQGCPSSGGSRTAWTWRGCGHRIGRRNVRRDRRRWTGQRRIWRTIKSVGGIL